jgi:hypothetical protein
MDPLALRLKNYAERDPMDDLPYSTKELARLLRQGAERFGWAAQPQEPRSMREGHELVGWGMATGTWDAMQMFARASAVLHADGRLVVSSAATDIGTGTYTVMAHDRRGGHGPAAGAGDFPAGRLDAAGGADRRRLGARGHRRLGRAGRLREAAESCGSWPARCRIAVRQGRFEEVEFADGTASACASARRGRSR